MRIVDCVTGQRNGLSRLRDFYLRYTMLVLSSDVVVYWAPKVVTDVVRSTVVWPNSVLCFHICRRLSAFLLTKESRSGAQSFWPCKCRCESCIVTYLIFPQQFLCKARHSNLTVFRTVILQPIIFMTFKFSSSLLRPFYLIQGPQPEPHVSGGFGWGLCRRSWIQPCRTR